jgi:hypothetical protein
MNRQRALSRLTIIFGGGGESDALVTSQEAGKVTKGKAVSDDVCTDCQAQHMIQRYTPGKY